jgi:hypothetical protein
VSTDHFAAAEPSVAMMSAHDDAPRAVLLVAAGDEPFVVSVDHAVPCDLDLVDRLLWLRLVATRLGWMVHVEHVDDDLAELLELVGVASSLGLDT